MRKRQINIRIEESVYRQAVELKARCGFRSIGALIESMVRIASGNATGVQEGDIIPDSDFNIFSEWERTPGNANRINIKERK